MCKKNIWISILSGLMFWFIFYSYAAAGTNAAAGAIDATLAWNSLIDDFYLVVEDSDASFSDGDLITKGQFKNSKLGTDIQVDKESFHTESPVFEIWSLDPTAKFNKKINKKITKALKTAAKLRQIDLFGKKKGWKDEFYKWQNTQNAGEEGLWNLYAGNEYVKDAFNGLEGTVIKGKIGDVKFYASLDIVSDAVNSAAVEDIPISTSGGTVTGGIGGDGFGGGGGLYPNPEPATMLLFGFGLLGLAGVSRRKNNAIE